MTNNFMFAVILCLGTISTRFLPFIFEKKLMNISKYNRVNSILIAFLIGYIMLRSIFDFQNESEIKIKILASVVVVIIYKTTRNIFVSILLGTSIVVLGLNYLSGAIL